MGGALLPVALAAAVVAGIEGWCGRTRPAALALAAGATAWFGLVWLAAFGRPLHAGAAAAVIGGGVLLVSGLKSRFLGEPLVLPDFAFLPEIPRFPRLFYLDRRGVALVGAALLLVPVSIAAFVALEPPALSGGERTALLLGCLLATAPFLPGPLRRDWAARLRAGGFAADLGRDLDRFGTLGLLLAQAVAWPEQPLPGSPPDEAQDGDVQTVIVVQAESFVDLRRFGRPGPELPDFDALKGRAVQHGLLQAAGSGAYTVRPECAMLTGLGRPELGLDALHPYLRPDRLAAHALPGQLRRRGWRTLFVHPFDGTFYRRDTVMPKLGFERFLDEAAFADADRVGPYVSDAAVADRILREVDAAGRDGKRLFAFAVTMEAHDPYGAGRFPDEADPVRQFERHMRNADAMMGRLARGLAARGLRALLVVYGDHVPFLPEFADPFPDLRTDYVVVRFGGPADTADTAGTADPPARVDTRPELLACRLREMM